MEVTRRGLFGDGIKLLLAATLGGILGNEFLRGTIVGATTSAEYPTSVVPWTDVGSGDVVQARHVNQLYAEVRSMESDIIDGGMKLQTPVTVEG
jgi:hypothetical protein